MSNQSARQASVRSVTGTSFTYEGDWHAYWNTLAVPAGTFNERMLAWVNGRLGANYFDVNSAMAAYAISQGVSDWNSLGSFSTATISPDEPASVILLMGQSNMVGTDITPPLYTYDPVLDPISPRIFQYSPDGQGDPAKALVAIQAIDPLLHPGVPGTERAVGPGMPFSRQLLTLVDPTKKIILVPCAVGSTALVGSNWQPPSGVQYVQALNTLVSVLNAFPNATCDYMLWWQGERDMDNVASPATYASTLDTLIDGMRAAHTRAANAAFLIHGVVPQYAAVMENRRNIQYALANTSLRRTKSYYMSPPLDASTLGDVWHATTVSQRQIGFNWANISDRAAFYAANVPATPTASLEGEVVVITLNGAPSYVVQYRAAGSSDPWLETIVYQLNWESTIRRVVIPGSGARECRVVARSIAGDSAPTSVMTYNIPVTAAPTFRWYHDYDTSPVSGTTFTSIVSTGTDTTAWAVGGTPQRVLVNSVGALDITVNTQFLKRDDRIAAGSYTLIHAFYNSMPNNSENALFGVGTLTNQDAQAYMGPSSGLEGQRLAHNGSGAGVSGPIYGLTGFNYICTAIVYDSTISTDNLKMYVNGALMMTGTIPARIRNVTSSKVWNYFQDTRTSAFTGIKLAFAMAESALTQDQIVKATHDIKTKYSIEWGM